MKKTKYSSAQLTFPRVYLEFVTLDHPDLGAPDITQGIQTCMDQIDLMSNEAQGKNPENVRDLCLEFNGLLRNILTFSGVAVDGTT